MPEKKRVLPWKKSKVHVSVKQEKPKLKKKLVKKPGAHIAKKKKPVVHTTEETLKFLESK